MLPYQIVKITPFDWFYSQVETVVIFQIIHTLEIKFTNEKPNTTKYQNHCDLFFVV